MSKLLETLYILNQKIDYVGNLEYRIGNRARTYQEQVGGELIASESTDGEGATIKVTLNNNNITMRKLMESFYNAGFNQDGKGLLNAKIVIDRSIADSLIFIEGSLKELPPITSQETTDYMFHFSYKSQ